MVTSKLPTCETGSPHILLREEYSGISMEDNWKNLLKLQMNISFDPKFLLMNLLHRFADTCIHMK